MPHFNQVQTRSAPATKTAQVPPIQQQRGPDFSSRIAQLQKTMGNRGTMALIQAKFKIGERTEKGDILEYLRTEGPAHLPALQGIYGETVGKLPPQVQKELNARIGELLTIESFYQGAEEWYDGANHEYEYESNEAGLKKLLKHVIKYNSFKHGWKTVGTAAYMTGDATGLGIAAAIDPRLTLKVLKGKQTKDVPGPSIYKEDRLPPAFEELRGQGQIKEMDVDAEVGSHKTYLNNQNVPVEYQGTQDVYGVKYNLHRKNLKLKPKPWNFETYKATETIRDHYRGNEDKIAEQLLPPATEDATRENIKEFKRRKGLTDQKCILLWQRLSGRNGGAHPELDSTATMLKQMAKSIREKFADRTIILIGDNALSKEELAEAGITENVISLHKYWESEDAKQLGIFTNREQQNYFLKLLSDENQAVSVGMRSGSLESSALLGIRTIFLDDLDNNAQERMEFWAGDAAYDRKNHLGADFDEFEKGKEGAIPNYKRVATENKLGVHSDELINMCTTLHKKLVDLQTENEDKGEDSRLVDPKEKPATNKTLNDLTQAISKYMKGRGQYKTKEDYNQKDKGLIEGIKPFFKALSDQVDQPATKFSKNALAAMIKFLDQQVITKSKLTDNELEEINKLIEYLGKPRE